MTRPSTEIDEQTLRRLVAEFSFKEIARMYRCGARSVAALAARYGLESAFAVKTATEDEDSRILALLHEGATMNAVALELGRSHEFVVRRSRRLLRVEEDEAWVGLIGSGWPLPEVTPEAALNGRRFEDVSRTVLDRECPPGRLPINGTALAAAARASRLAFSRSTAELCAEERTWSPNADG